MKPELSADYERKDGLFLTQREWEDLAAVCWLWLDSHPDDLRRPLLERVIDAAHIDGDVSAP